MRIPLRYLPLLAQRSDQTVSNSSLEIAGRLEPGLTLAQAQAECLVIWRNAMEEHWKGDSNTLARQLRIGMELEPIERGVSILREHFRVALLVLGVSVGLLQLMLCANLAGLMLARNAERHEEIAVRLALGAPRRRLVRQMFAESVMLALLGVAAGLAMAHAAIPLLMSALPPIRDAGNGLLGLSLEVGLDRRVLLFSIVAAVLTVFFFGLAPAIASSRLSLDSVVWGLRSARTWRGQRRLLVAQVALCTLLLAAAGLLVRTFKRLSAANPGFDRDHIVSFTVNPWVSGYSEAQTEALRLALTARVGSLPGVASVATAERPVMRGSGMKFTIAPAGQKIAPGDNLNASLNSVSPEYFETMGIKVVAGRGFDAAQTSHAKPVMVVVNEAFARRFFPDISPVGKRFGTPNDPDGMEIIGVVSDAKYRSLREPAPPTVYGKLAGEEDDFVLYARTRIQPESLIQPVRRELAALDPTISFTEVHTLAEEVEESAASERLTAELGTAFGILAALLAAIGIYGLFAAVVAQRRREIAIRMALGADRNDVRRLIALQVLKITAGGVIAGLAAALFLGPLTRSLLYGITPYDAISLFAAASFVVSVAVLGAAVPAFRATHIQPGITLRHVQ
jgi:predicted permease